MSANQDTWDHELILSILANEKNCVLHCTEEKIYLNPGKIHPTNQGVYLNLKDEEFVFIPCLISDSEGCYIKSFDADPVTKCPECGRRKWGGCDNPNCGEHQKREQRKEDYQKRKEDRMEEKRQEKEKSKNKKH